jgi:hypothetical protein
MATKVETPPGVAPAYAPSYGGAGQAKIRLPSEGIADNALRAMKLAAITALNLSSLQLCQQTPSGFFAPK